MLRCIIAAALTVALGGTAGAQTAIVCGPAAATCGPAIIGVPGGGASPVLPSWATAMLAAWMLDEPSGTRVNLQGTTSRNLTENGGTVANDTTNKMEGTAAALLTATTALQTADAVLKVIPAPFTCGLWARRTVANSVTVLGVYNYLVDGFIVYHNSDNNWQWNMFGQNNLYFGPANLTNTWTHVALSYSGGVMQPYKDGVAQPNTTGGYTLSTGTVFQIGAQSFVGQLDELWCAGTALSAASICRICSCGVRGEQCTCSGTAFATKGRNATACNSCTLPANCAAAAPS